MASHTQIVVVKGIPNPLIAENLLKILRDLTHLIPLQNHLPIPANGIIGPHKTIFISLQNESRAKFIMLTLNIW